ncbi:MAG: glycosyltransferase family 2 protein [Hyphomonas sp.]|nr:glycosyltransferase family 2 protein [Hyphomonas sp.]
MTPSLAVAIPTFRRNAGLEQAIRSVFAQDHATPFELIIADNDPDGGAAELACRLADEAPVHIRVLYAHVPEPGVANARNAALASTEARLIAFLDDDQSASRGWLSALLRCHANFPAAATFGPIDTVLPESVTSHTAYFRQFFCRMDGAGTGYIPRSYGCGNSLLDRDLIPQGEPVFDARMNESGGEDDVLFQRIREAGGQFAWAADALAFEHVPAERARLGYTLKRAVSYGQGPIAHALRQSPINYATVAFWMAVGLYKFAVNVVAYAFLWAVRSDRRADHLDKAARGAGKLVWWKRLNFYGAARLSGEGKPVLR